MRIARPKNVVVMVVSILALFGFGCDSTQPDSINSGTASVTLNTRALVDIYHCYEVWVDTSNPPDGTPDENTGFTACEPASPAGGGGTSVKAQRAVPWRYALTISVIRAGTTNEVVVQSDTGVPGSSVQPGDGIPDFISMTDYDPGVDSAPAKPPVDQFYYLFGKTVSVGSRVYLASVGADLGPPNILTIEKTNAQTPPTFDFIINSGDTVVVRARKEASVTGLPPGVSPDQETEITLSGELAVGGVQVATNGTSVSSFEDKSGFTFSFTAQ